MLKTIVLSCAVLLTIIAAGFSADLSGVWKGKVISSNGEVQVTYKFQADGDKLSGTSVSKYGDVPILDGKIDAGAFTFKVLLGNVTVEHEGKFMGDSVLLVIKAQGGSFKTTLKRAESK